MLRELDAACHEGEERVVSADPDADAGVELRAPLADEDVPRDDLLAAIALDPKTLGIGVAAVPSGTAAFLGREKLKVEAKHDHGSISRGRLQGNTHPARGRTRIAHAITWLRAGSDDLSLGRTEMIRRAALAVVLATVLVAPLAVKAEPPLPRLAVASADFVEGGALPPSATLPQCGGQNRSPELHWSEAPAKTESFVVVVRDLDAHPTRLVHWLLFNVPAAVTELPPAVGGGVPPGAVTGLSDFGSPRYDGPCPPRHDLPHRYAFTVFAIGSTTLPGAGANTSGAALHLLLRGRVLAVGRIIGRYTR